MVYCSVITPETAKRRMVVAVVSPPAGQRSGSLLAQVRQAAAAGQEGEDQIMADRLLFMVYSKGSYKVHKDSRGIYGIFPSPGPAPEKRRWGGGKGAKSQVGAAGRGGRSRQAGGAVPADERWTKGGCGRIRMPPSARCDRSLMAARRAGGSWRLPHRP
jgi:hypothetical protein